ncbi:MAG: hypothetical protein AABX96_03040 [Nanoarchaeota archaeon]
MRLTKPMLKAFSHIIQGENTITQLAKALNKSIYWTSRVLQNLEKEAFITKIRSHSLLKSRVLIEIAQTPHAIKLRELLFTYTGINFEEILADSRILFLAAICEDWMNISIIKELSGVSSYIIDRYRPKLKNRGVIIYKNGLYRLNQEGWMLLKEFVLMYKNYSNIGEIKWKYNEEIILEVHNEKLLQGAITGLYAYKKYGINIGVISVLCYLPKKELSKEEIFIHSLFEVDDPRTLNLALTFYLKNKLNYNKTLPIAMKYSKYTMFENFVRLLDTKEDILNLDTLPTFDHKDFIRIAGMYGVKHVY